MLCVKHLCFSNNSLIQPHIVGIAVILVEASHSPLDGMPPHIFVCHARAPLAARQRMQVLLSYPDSNHHYLFTALRNSFNSSRVYLSESGYSCFSCSKISSIVQ